METYYKKNREKLLAYARKYHKEHSEYQKKWRASNPDKIKGYREKHTEKQKEYYRNWYKENGRNRTEGDREKILEWKQEHPERVKIQLQLQYAIRKGKVKRPETCPRCDRKTRIHAHHTDYKHYMNFIWLCASCHRKEHTK